jgi:CRISPR-associated exonuclease Cas4
METITGTLIWYYYVCKREVWLMSRELTPEQDNSFIEIGRILHHDSYPREKKEIIVGNIKLDIIKKEKGQIVVAEIKKSSRFEKPARMQLAFYLYRLKEMGIETRGELLIPKEKKRISVELNENTEEEIKRAFIEIKDIISQDVGPQPVKNAFCHNCAYREFCWI